MRFQISNSVFDVQTQAAGGVSDGEGGGSGMPVCVAKSLHDLALASDIRFDALERRSSLGIQATDKLTVAAGARFDDLENTLERNQGATREAMKKLLELTNKNRGLVYENSSLLAFKATQEVENASLRQLHESHLDSRQHYVTENARLHQLLFDQKKLAAEIPSLLGQISDYQAELKRIQATFSTENGALGLGVRDAKEALDEITRVTKTSKERLRRNASLEEFIRLQSEELKISQQVAQITIFCHITARHHI